MRQKIVEAIRVEAEPAAKALIAIDPTHEEAHRYLIRQYAEMGNTPAALRQYQLLWNILAEEYDIEPDDKTQDLIVAIKSGAFALQTSNLIAEIEPNGAAGVPPEVVPQLPVIELAAFAQLGPSSNDDHSIEGLRRDLIAALVRFREWIIVEGRSLVDSGGKDKQSDYLVEGSFYEEDGNVHIVFTLKNQLINKYIWSERVCLSLEGWFEILRQIVRKIALSLNVYLPVDRMRMGIGSGDQAAQIYSRWLVARDLIYRWRPLDGLRAEQDLRLIIDEAPTFPPPIPVWSKL